MHPPRLIHVSQQAMPQLSSLSCAPIEVTALKALVAASKDRDSKDQQAGRRKHFCLNCKKCHDGDELSCPDPCRVCGSEDHVRSIHLPTQRHSYWSMCCAPGQLYVALSRAKHRRFEEEHEEGPQDQKGDLKVCIREAEWLVERPTFAM